MAMAMAMAMATALAHRIEVGGEAMTDPRDLIKRLADIADALDGRKPLVSAQGQAMDGFTALANFRALADEARAYLAQPEPTLTAQDCNNMPKHGESFIAEVRFGEIVLDGCFTREDLIEIANTVPSTEA
jgi:hypothetical protein